MYKKNDYESEVERRLILKKIKSFFHDVKPQKTIFNLYGESGMGKSYICNYIYNSPIGTFENKVLVDFNKIEYKNIPGIIEIITANLPSRNFIETHTFLEKYYKSIDASKAECLNHCVVAFIQELNMYSSSCKNRILVIFDTYEMLPQEVRENELKRIIDGIKDNVYVFIAGIHKINLYPCVSYMISGFNENEIESFFVNRNPKMKMIFKKHGKFLSSRIHEFTDGGHPILCGLLSDYIEKCSDIPEQLSYMIDTDRTNAYNHLISWINNLDSEIVTSLKITAYFNNRMTASLLSEITNMPIEQCRSCIQELLTFSFVKNISEIDESNPQIVLHGIVADLIKKYYPYTANERYTFAFKAMQAYNRMIADESYKSRDFKTEKIFRVERILAWVKNVEYAQAFSLFDNELLDALDSFDYSFVNQLISEVDTCKDIKEKKEWTYFLLVSKAELKLTQYDARAAINIYRELQASELYNLPIFKALADSVYGRALINPCTVEENLKLTDAIDVLDNVIPLFNNQSLESRLVKIYYWLGIAYAHTGQNDLAYKAFEKANTFSKTNIQRLNILLEISKMIRLQQNVIESLDPLRSCEAIMLTLNKNKGKYYYYKGNAYRDLGNINVAVSYYDKAISELDNGDDDFTLCELYLDYAWLEYLRSDNINNDNLFYYLNKGWNLAQKYKFGTEFSEYYHILYEIKAFGRQFDEAYKDLNSALEYAYKYSNIYMLLDCLNHKAQMHYRKNEWEEIPEVIKEMEKIELTGCKIHVFRGRAKLVQADVYFNECDYIKALQEYFEGFLIVALYGNSYTNVELFGDLYFNVNESDNISRKEKFRICMENIPMASLYRNKFYTDWESNDVSHNYDYFIEDVKNCCNNGGTHEAYISECVAQGKIT